MTTRPAVPDSRPLFEIGPGSLMHSGRVLSSGATVPDAILDLAVKGSEGWTIPGMEHCTRPVLKVGYVGVNDGGAALALAEQMNADYRDSLAQAERDVDAARNKNAELQAQLSTTSKLAIDETARADKAEGALGSLGADLSAAKRDLTTSRRRATTLANKVKDLEGS